MEEIAVLRMLERMLTVSIAGLSIYLGYRLFFHLPFEQDNEGELTLPGLKVVLSRVGPGIFFAAFGSAVLVFSLSKPVTLKAAGTHSSEPPHQAATGGERVEGLGDLAGEQGRQVQEFTGVGPRTGQSDGSVVSPQQRSGALQAVEMLNCIQRLVGGRHADFAEQSVPAVREAKRALLLSVWDADNWGESAQLTVAGLSPGASVELSDRYFAHYQGCPQ